MKKEYDMKRVACSIWLMFTMSVLLFAATCHAKSVEINKATDVYKAKEDIENNEPFAHFNEGDIVDIFYDDILNVGGTDYVHAIGMDMTENNVELTNGYVEENCYYSIIENIRTLDRLSPGEIRTLHLAAEDAIYNNTGILPTTDYKDLLTYGYIDIQLAGNCAVVSFRDARNEFDTLYKAEFLFTFDDNGIGEYQTLYIEQNGKGVFGSYEPLLETDFTEKILGTDYKGFVYKDKIEK